MKNMTLVGQDTKTVIDDRFARHVSSGKVEFFAQAGIDFIAGRREGIYLWDLEGTALINCHCNGGVFNLGHRHPRVIAALQKALAELDIGNHHLVSEARVLLAERLSEISASDLNRVVFGVSGGESIDLAIKLARAHTHRPKVISAIGGYHGHTGLALAAGDEQYRKPFEPLSPGFVQVPFGDLEALEEALGDDVAAVLFETIPATQGITIPPESFFRGVRMLCDQFGTVMIADEVQTGLGRCGAVWGIDTYDVTPDIIVAGKGLSGGIYPITTTIYREHLNPFLHTHPFIHISTFGGAEIGCYVALEVLNILEEPGFLKHVLAMSELFRRGFADLKERHPQVVVEFRQRGMMMGMKLADARLGPLATQLGFQNGLLTIFANNDPSVLQILPPLIIQPDEANLVLERLESIVLQIEGIFLRNTSP